MTEDIGGQVMNLNVFPFPIHKSGLISMFTFTNQEQTINTSLINTHFPPPSP